LHHWRCLVLWPKLARALYTSSSPALNSVKLRCYPFQLYTLSPPAALQSHSVKAVCHHYLGVVVCGYLSQKPDRQNTDDDGESKPSRVMRCSVSGSINHRRRSWSRRCSSIRCTSHRRSRARCLNCRRWEERYTWRGSRCCWREHRLRYGDARRWRCRDAWRAGRLRLSGAT
jgi:hypothetical protein